MYFIRALPGSAFDCRVPSRTFDYGGLLIVTLLGISIDYSGSTFDCDTLLMFFCSTLCMQILWYCLKVPMISALPGRNFDCDSSWKFF